MFDRERAERALREVGQRIAQRVQPGIAALRRYGAVVFGRGVPLRQRLGYITGGLVAFFALVMILVVFYALILIPLTPGIGEIRKARSERPTIVYSVDGVKLTEFKPVNRQWVGLEEIAPEVRMALLATEDHRFYEHRGVDYRRVVGAAIRTLTGNREGASTITQQLARNLYPQRIGRRATLNRKLRELVTTIKIEIALSKDEILETYLNTVPFLYDAYGIELAARTYYGVSAADLTIEQSAMLVGMLKGTAYYNPVRHAERAMERRNLVFRRMVRHGFLQEDRYDIVANSPVRLSFQRQPRMQSVAPHFTENVRRWVTNWAHRRGYNVYRDSLVVHTTLDSRLQEVARQSVDQWMPVLQAIANTEWSQPQARLVSRSPSAYGRADGSGAGFSHLWEGRPDLVGAFVRATPQYRAGVADGISGEAMLDSLQGDASFMSALRELKTRLEVGFVAVHPETGHVRAWVGSRDYAEVPYDHVAVARRQPGSTFKPIVYAAALENGFRPDDLLVDEEIEMTLAGGEVWRPTNAGGSASGNEMSLADGLAFSKNTITAQLIDRVGTRRVARMGERMGIRHSPMHEVPSLALGTSEVTLLEMVSTYATLANAGVSIPPVLVERVEDRRGRTVYEARPRARRALKEENALRIVDMMRGVVDRGTGQRIRNTFGISEDVVGKTGTTQGNVDGWFIGMHPELVAGAWVGFGDPRVAFRTDYWGAGGNNALLIVGEFYQRAFRHPDTRLVEIRFPDAPAYEERTTVWQRVGGWLGDAAGAVGDAISDAASWVANLFRDEDDEHVDPAPPPRDQPSEPDDYTPPWEDPEHLELLARADSVAQARRDSLRMEELMERLDAIDSEAEAEDEDEPDRSDEEPFGRQGDGNPPGMDDDDDFDDDG